MAMISVHANAHAAGDGSHKGVSFNANADKVAFEAALATLVADGASPTQAHVTAANSAYTTFKADLGADVAMIVNVANITSVSMLRAVVKQMLDAIPASILKA